MSIIEQIARLKEDRRIAVQTLDAINAEAQRIKDKHLNAQNALHQQRIDTEHRIVMAKCYKQQDVLTHINTQLKLLHSQLRADQSKSRRERGL